VKFLFEYMELLCMSRKNLVWVNEGMEVRKRNSEVGAPDWEGGNYNHRNTMPYFEDLSRLSLATADYSFRLTLRLGKTAILGQPPGNSEKKTDSEEVVLMITLDINGQQFEPDVMPDAPLLWVIREHLRLSGTKYSCGIGLCGACTVHVNGEAQRSCQMRAADAQGKKITTIEGLSEDHPLINSWIDWRDRGTRVTANCTRRGECGL
jgi:hypothetical protein